MMVPTQSPASFIKPTLETRFHIDYGWWNRQGRALPVYLRSHLCEEHRSMFVSGEEGDFVDWVYPETAEVQRVDLLQYTLRTHCSQQDDYLTGQTALVDSLFLIFLSNGNRPLTPLELAGRIGREGQAKKILRILSGRRVYKGLRPLF